MKILKFLALGLLLLVIVVGLVGMVLPDARHVERQITIDAPAAKVFPYVNNLKKFNQWSPWVKVEPVTQYIFDGPESGVGATMKWTSDNKTVSGGSQEIVESELNSQVKTLLKFGKNDLSMATFTLSESAGKTTVLWEFDINFSTTIARYFGMMMDEWVGDTYEQGLTQLKTLVEAQP